MHVILQHQVPIGSQCPWSNLSSLSTPSWILEPRNFEDCYCNQTTSAGNIIQNLRRKGSKVCICRDDIDSYRCYSTVSNPWVSLEACLDRSTRPSYPPGGSSTCGLETKNCDVSPASALHLGTTSVLKHLFCAKFASCPKASSTALCQVRQSSPRPGPGWLHSR